MGTYVAWMKTNPPDSGIAAYFMRAKNVWLDDEGNEHMDLKEFGFSARERETIYAHMHTYPEAEYACFPNQNLELVEIHWIDPFWYKNGDKFIDEYMFELIELIAALK